MTTSPPLPTTTATPAARPPRRGSWLVRLARERSVRIAVLCWVVANIALIALAGRHLPFHASSLATPPTVEAVLSADAMVLEVFALMGVVVLLTRRRNVPDLAARAPARPVAKRETLGLIGYGIVASVVGFLLARAFGWHAFSLHIDGSVVGTDQEVVPAEVLAWSLYNVVVYALVPFVVFRRRYSAERLNLRSSNRRGDLLVIAVVLVLESAVQLSLGAGILDLSGRQILLGAPLTFALSFLGTVLPAMVFVYCVLTPRYLALTGSVPTTVILGGLTYAMLHFFDGWTNFASPTDAVLSVLFLLVFYTGPGMFKTFLTVRTANAWTHVWAYHAIAPHTLTDTPMFVKVFGIR